MEEYSATPSLADLIVRRCADLALMEKGPCSRQDAQSFRKENLHQELRYHAKMEHGDGTPWDLFLRFRRPADEERTRMDAIEKTVIQRFKTAVLDKLGAATFIVFGYRARGDADVYSDMDVVVILEREVHQRSRDVVSDCAWDAGFPHGIVVVPVVFSREEWDTGAVRQSLLGKAVRQEGLPV